MSRFVKVDNHVLIDLDQVIAVHESSGYSIGCTVWFNGKKDACYFAVPFAEMKKLICGEVQTGDRETNESPPRPIKVSIPIEWEEANGYTYPITTGAETFDWPQLRGKRGRMTFEEIIE